MTPLPSPDPQRPCGQPPQPAGAAPGRAHSAARRHGSSGGSARPAAKPLAADPVFLWDRREADFVLWEFFRLDQTLLGQPPFDGATRAGVAELLDRAQGHAQRLAAAFSAADRTPAHRLGNDEVAIPAAFPALWEEHRRDWFWLRQQADYTVNEAQHPRRFPLLVAQAVMEQFLGANPSFMMYCGFTPAAASLVRQRGSARQRELLLDKLDSVQWDACFSATEREAGSDLAAVQTTAEPLQDDVYAIRGEKLYITAGMHPLTENTVHLVIGRLASAGSSSLSLSCFLVPRYWPEPDGRLVPNHVDCAEVADKMGFNGCANTRLVFGASGTTRAFLLGDRPNIGLLQVAPLMSRARIYTGLQAVALASSAYLHALQHARRRVQGAPFDQAANPRAFKVTLVEHLDVQRMLLDMKAKVEGGRLLMGRISIHSAQVQRQLHLREQAQPEFDAAELERHERLLWLYGPIGKAYVSEEAWDVVTTAIQVHGAMGYMRSLPLEQCARDLKVLTIWEGTTYVQAQQLLRDRLDFGRRSEVLSTFQAEIGQCLARSGDYPALAPEFTALRQHLDSLLRTLAVLGRRASQGQLLEVSQFCTRVLSAFGDLIVGWSLLEAACIAQDALRRPRLAAVEAAFYTGKCKAARHFLLNLLPRVDTLLRAVAHPAATVLVAPEEFGFEQPEGVTP